MQVVNPQLILGKKVLLRLDIDVPIGKDTGNRLQVTEDFRLRAGLPTIHLCLEHALRVIIMGHIGRPTFADSASVATSAKGAATAGKPDRFFIPKYSVAPIAEWLSNQGLRSHLTSGKLKVLENLRFDPREESGDLSFAKELVNMGDMFVNEAFASYRPAVSTTILPTLLPHAAGLRFAEEVKVLTGVRDNPKKPFIAIMGGAKVADKLPVIKVLAQKADAVLVGGKLIHEIREQDLKLPKNVMVGMLSGDGFDIAPQTTEAWGRLISDAATIVWNGPVGKFEDPKNNQTKKLAEMILDTSAEIVIGGGDSVAALSQYGLLQKAEGKAFVSTGGGAMLKLLTDGTLPTIQALA